MENIINSFADTNIGWRARRLPAQILSRQQINFVSTYTFIENGIDFSLHELRPTNWSNPATLCWRTSVPVPRPA